MTIAAATLAGNFSNTDATSYATASVTPTANRLVLIAVMGSTLGSSAAPTLSGNGLTYVEVASQHLGDAGNRLSVFRAMGASPSAGAITIDFAGVTQLRCHWSVVEFSDVDTGGSNGADGVRQSATAVGANVSSLEVTLAAFGNSANATYGAFGWNELTISAFVGAGFTQLHWIGPAEQPRYIFTEWRADNDTSVDMSWNALVDNSAGIALELKSATPAASGTRMLASLGVGT